MYTFNLVRVEFSNSPDMNSKLFKVLLFIKTVNLVAGVAADKTILEGQGLIFCEDPSAHCTISIETEDQKTWVPSSAVHDKNLIMDPDVDCSCGLRMLNISRDFDKNIVKFGLREILVEYRINVIPFNKLPTKTYVVPFGQRIAAECDFPNSLEILHCRMELKEASNTFKWCHKRYYSENETITCQATVKGSADPVYSKVVIIIEPFVKRIEKPNGFYRCTASLGSAESCIAEDFATKTIVNLEDNLLGQEFSSQMTRLDHGVCELQVLSSLTYRGPWRIMMKMKSLKNTFYDFEGCMFNAALIDSDKVIKDLLNEITVPKFLLYRPNMTITCPNTPYPLTRCYLLVKNEIILPVNDLFQRTSKLGICIFLNLEIETGEVVCNFNSHDPSLADLQQKYIVEENTFVKISKPILRKASYNTSSPIAELELLCKLSFVSGLTNCLFVSPFGRLYHLPTSKFSNQTHSYKGKGLSMGECGAVISVIEEQAFGNWSCYIEANLFSKNLVIPVLENMYLQ